MRIKMLLNEDIDPKGEEWIGWHSNATARRHKHVQCWNAIALAAAPRLPLAKPKFDKHQRHPSPLDSERLSNQLTTLSDTDRS
jgi:hypothetical protein